MTLNPVFRLLRAAPFILAVNLSCASADPVIEWNEAMTGVCEHQQPPGSPILEVRAYAMAHVAIFDAVVAARRNGSGEAAAAAQAAHDVLIKTIASGAPVFDALLARELGELPDGQAKAAGVSLGAAAAVATIAARANDNATGAEGPYKPGSRPGDYRFTPPFDGPPFNGFAVVPLAGRVTPFILKSADQFRAPPPYTLSDPEYVFDFDEVKVLGARNSTVRTEDQTEMAEFWYEMAWFAWNRIARTLAVQQPDSLLDHARLFAALNVAIADAFIAGFDSKYTYSFWRPITAIHGADNDGNNLTSGDPDWQPLMTTPPMPDYISTHASLGAAASVVLIWYFHGDERAFTFSSTMSSQFPNLRPRTFHRITDAAVENAISRVYAGIHFRFACLSGLTQGRKVGAWIVQNAPYTSGR
jgi:PAP2 superfamily protein